MKTVNPREMPGKNFYFQGSELVVNEDALPELYPRIEAPEEGRVRANPEFKILSLVNGQSQVENFDTWRTLEPADLPGEQGIITPKGKLIRMDGLDGAGSRMLDWAVASWMAQTAEEYAKVEKQIGIGFQFVPMFQRSGLVSAYVKYFDQEFGTDFTPTQEPRRLALAA